MRGVASFLFFRTERYRTAINIITTVVCAVPVEDYVGRVQWGAFLIHASPSKSDQFILSVILLPVQFKRAFSRWSKFVSIAVWRILEIASATWDVQRIPPISFRRVIHKIRKTHMIGS
jgi:hypothetical protein